MKNNQFIKTITRFFSKYKFLLIVLVFFFVGFIYALTSDETETKPNDAVPTQNTDIGEHEEEPEDHVNINSKINKPGLQKKEQKIDGTIEYTFTSAVTGKSNKIITQGDETLLFESIVIDPAFPVAIADFEYAFGQPERIIPGSSYGQQTAVYIYASRGIAFIANTKTNLVLEQHSFQPMEAATYLQKYR